MHMSQGGLDNLLKKFEGCKLKAYRCPAGILTIGYGHTSAAGAPEVHDGMTITQDEAETILKNDLVKYERPVASLVKVDLEQNQFDVLVDFAYNAGVGNLKTSGLLKKVNAGDFDAVPDELMKWTKGGGKVLPGLVRRRQAESAWWNAHQDHPHDHQDHRSDPDPVPAPSMVDSKQGNAALVTGGLGTLGAAKEVAAQAQDASDTVDQIMGLLHNTNFLIMVIIIGLGAAIWFWRKQHMEAHGV
jgi:GH24 family phage-related lysozyme (muramidase)